MVDIRRPISSIESGVLYPPIISLDCDHWSVTVYHALLETLNSFARGRQNGKFLQINSNSNP